MKQNVNHVVPIVLPVFEGEYIGWDTQFVTKPENGSSIFDDLLGGVKPGKKKKVFRSTLLRRGPAGLCRDAGFDTFLSGISRNWVLKLRETGLDTPTKPRMS